MLFNLFNEAHIAYAALRLKGATKLANEPRKLTRYHSYLLSCIQLR